LAVSGADCKRSEPTAELLFQFVHAHVSNIEALVGVVNSQFEICNSHFSICNPVLSHHIRRQHPNNFLDRGLPVQRP
jgi:hypothetical protein